MCLSIFTRVVWEKEMGEIIELASCNCNKGCCRSDLIRRGIAEVARG